MGLQVVEQALEQQFLAGQRAFLGAQRLVLEGLEFGRDEALGVLQCLAAPVVGRHLVGLALRDLDVEAMHLVELHAQIGDAGAGAFALFELEQEAVAVVLDRAQLVKFGVEAGGDDAAVAHQRGRVFTDRGTQQLGCSPWWGQQVVATGRPASHAVQHHRRRQLRGLVQRDARRPPARAGAPGAGRCGR